MEKNFAIERLRAELTECSPGEAQALEDILVLGAGDLGLPDGAILSGPDWLPPDRRHAYMALRETLEHHSEGEEYHGTRAGGWEHVLLTLVLEADWRTIRRTADALNSDDELVQARDVFFAPPPPAGSTPIHSSAERIICEVIDLLSLSRHTFRSRQIQRARRLLEGLIPQNRT